MESPQRDDVFINCPFDSDYEPLFVALVAGLVAVRKTPRCVLEISSSRHRLSRLLEMVRKCPVSIHDLSRVEGGTRGAPRFNMPFELGLAVSVALGTKSHRWFVLETKPYRVQRTLSDINGFDPYIHGGTAIGVLREIRNMFRVTPRQPSLSELQSLHRLVRQRAKQLSKEHPSGIFTPSHFRELVVTAHSFAKELSL